MNPALSLDRVSLSLGGREILHDMSFALGPAEFVGVIGPNGAGKTTLLRIILGLMRPSSGRVELLDRAGGHGSKTVGYVAQRTSVDPGLPMRGRDFVSFGLDGERWGFALPSKKRTERIDEALEAVGARAFADAPIGRLSGGQQQRLFIAQALLSEPKVLLLDEPLSSLDLRSASEIVEVVDGLRRSRGVAVLFVTHDINPLMDVMDRVVYMASGRAAVGNVDDVVRTPVLSALYGYHVDVARLNGRVVVLAAQPDALSRTA